MWGCVYFLSNELGELYIGSSVNFCRRLYKHKCLKSINMNCLWYWDYFEEGEYESIEELREREKEYIRKNFDCINSRKYNSSQKKYENNKEKNLTYCKEWYKNNKQKVLENVKKYNQTNKEKILNYSKIYTETNKQKKAEYDKKRYNEKREK